MSACRIPKNPFPASALATLALVSFRSGWPRHDRSLRAAVRRHGGPVVRAILADAAGRGLGRVLQPGQTQVTPDQASQLSPAQVTAIAAHAEEQHAGVIDEVSQFYAQHSGLIKTLGGAALAIALAKMKENATRG
jgi:hypothetical protein